MPTKIYDYFCRIDKSPTRDAIERQFQLAHTYYNRRIELVRKKWDDYQTLCRKHSVDLVEIETRIAELEKQLADALAKLNTSKINLRSKVGGEDERETVASLKDQLRDARVQRAGAKTTIKESESFAAELETLKTKFNDDCKALYAEFADLYWGTKNAIADAVENASKKTKFGPPRFRRWTRDGRIYCQVMGGIDVSEAYGDDGRVQIEPVKKPDGSNHKKHCHIRMRIGTIPGTQKPIWAEVFAWMHRPLPIGYRIVGVQLIRREGPWHRHADGQYHPHDDHHIQFVVSSAEQPGNLGSEKYAAIDLGWRMRPDGGLRVAYLVDSDGHAEELILPQSTWSRWEKSQSLQSTRDTLFNSMRDTLAEWLKLHPHPEKLKEATGSISQWRSINRLHAVIARWERFPGDEAVMESLHAWRDKDQHLDQWIRGNNTKAENQRKHLYRNFARRIEKTYGQIVVEDMDIAKMRENKPEESAEHKQSIDTYRNAASIGLLRMTLHAVMGKTRCKRIESALTTATCHACGTINEWDHAKLARTCTLCGAKWDQDYNAAKNMLANFGSGLRVC